MNTPMLNENVTHMDEQRMLFIDHLREYCDRLREELRVNELILQSVARSVSVKSEDVNQLDADLQARRDELAMHRPSVNSLPDAPSERIKREAHYEMPRYVAPAPAPSVDAPAARDIYRGEIGKQQAGSASNVDGK